MTVSVVTLTVPGRERMLAQCQEDIRRQTLEPLEHLIVHGDGSIGQKRNDACRMAKGSIILFADDDDRHMPWRVERQVQALLAYPEARLCGTSRYYAWDARDGYACEKTCKTVACGSICFWRTAWEENPFDDVSQGEANRFKTRFASATHDLLDVELFVAIRHGGNATGPSRVYGANRDDATAAVKRLLSI